jgi:hypothetical protein
LREGSPHFGITTQSREVISSNHNLGFYRTAVLYKSSTDLPTFHLIRSTTSTTTAESTR